MKKFNRLFLFALCAFIVTPAIAMEREDASESRSFIDAAVQTDPITIRLGLPADRQFPLVAVDEEVGRCRMTERNEFYERETAKMNREFEDLRAYTIGKIFSKPKRTSSR